MDLSTYEWRETAELPVEVSDVAYTQYKDSLLVAGGEGYMQEKKML